MGTVI